MILLLDGLMGPHLNYLKLQEGIILFLCTFINFINAVKKLISKALSL